MSSLCKIMEKHGSDKSVRNHNYTLVYSRLFNNIKDTKLRIFELGLGTNNTDVLSNMGVNGIPGASLFGWSEYFSKSDIFGADIDKRILFNKDNIHTFYCDQTNPQSIKELWENKLLDDGFDIMIEDGLHEYYANVCFFENSIHKLNIGGYYIIEDIKVSDIKSFEHKIKEWNLKYQELTFEICKLDHPVNNFEHYGGLSNNNILIVFKNS